MSRTARALACCLTLVALAVATACTNRADNEPESRATSGSTESARAPAYDLPSTWPVPEIPLPPGGTATQENVSDDLVFFHVDGVEAGIALAFYDDELPDLGLSRDTSSAINPVAYAGAELKVVVQSTEFGDVTLMITRP